MGSVGNWAGGDKNLVASGILLASCLPFYFALFFIFPVCNSRIPSFFLCLGKRTRILFQQPKARRSDAKVKVVQESSSCSYIPHHSGIIYPKRITESDLGFVLGGPVVT